MESQIKDDNKETPAMVFEIVDTIERSDNPAVVEMKQAVHETIFAECIAVCKMETMALNSAILVVTETFVTTEQKKAID